MIYHKEGHGIANLLKEKSRARFHALAALFRDVSDLAKINRDEAFAEGYIIGMIFPENLDGQLLMRFVSRYVSADPVLPVRQTPFARLK